MFSHTHPPTPPHTQIRGGWGGRGLGGGGRCSTYRLLSQIGGGVGSRVGQHEVGGVDRGVWREDHRTATTPPHRNYLDKKPDTAHNHAHNNDDDHCLSSVTIKALSLFLCEGEEGGVSNSVYSGVGRWAGQGGCHLGTRV